ncbi:MAG: hypothetical protein WAV95_08055 [Azonexus sp.]
MKNIAKFAVAASALVVSLSASAAFSNNMSISQISSEMKTRLAQGASLTVIATDARTSGVPGSLATLSMLSQSSDACGAVGALVRGGYEGKTVVNSAVAAGSSYKAMFACAVEAGADPTSMVDPTAAGGDPGGTGAGGGFGPFGATPTSTFGGGGGGVRASGS